MSQFSAQTDLVTQELVELQQKLKQADLPQDLLHKTSVYLQRVQRMLDSNHYSQEYDRLAHYVDWIVSLPWHKFSPDNLDLVKAQKILDTTHYGMQEPKDRILEYLATLKLKHQQNPQAMVKPPAIFLVGLVGTGKTTFAYSIAQATGRAFVRIPFGGLGSARDLRGRSRLFPEAEPGAIVKALRDAQFNNPVILLDEIDRVSKQQRADIMGVLVELLDPTQNRRFLDHYLDYPLDLSQVLFIATANNTAHVATAVLDRLEVIQMPSYTDEEKIHIGQYYLLPKILRRNGLTSSQLNFDQKIWPLIVRPLGFDAGIRTLERTLERVARKVARQIVESKLQTVTINQSNYQQYIEAL